MRISQVGVGGNVNVGKEFVDAMIEYNYRKFDMSAMNVPGLKNVIVGEVFFGLRFYTLLPNFMIGRAAVRITGGGLYGFDTEPVWRGLLFAGFTVSPVKSVSGLSFNVVYRPGPYTIKGYSFTPSWALRAGLIIGPSMK